MRFWTTGKQCFNVSNTMNTDAAYRLILSCDTTFICVEAPFLDKQCFQKKIWDIWSIDMEFMR